MAGLFAFIQSQYHRPFRNVGFNLGQNQGLVAQARKISATQEAKVEGSKLQGLSRIYNEFKASLCNLSSEIKGGGRESGGGVFDFRGDFN